MINQYQYFWIKVIEHFERNTYIHNGLTIPFLIGAANVLTGKKCSISQIMDEITDLGNKSRMTIMKCDYIGEFVVGVLDYESEQYYKTFPQSVNKEFKNLIVTDKSLYDIANLKELKSFMSKRYSEVVEDNCFSINHGIWSKFSDIEIDRINASISL